MHILLDSMPHHHVVKAVLAAPIFIVMFVTPRFRIDDKSLASPWDAESIIALLRIHRESFSLFLVDNDHSWSCSVDLDPLLDILESAGDDDFVGFFALDDNDDMPLRFKLTLEKPGVEKKVLEKERNEYIIEFGDVEKEDDSPYVVLLRLEELRSLNDWIGRSNSVWIYPTYLGGPPACLSCTLDPIGEISYFFPSSS
ncbi:hypothetical protein ACOSQ2_001004 [Xanthoceras sorbifolium]